MNTFKKFSLGLLSFALVFSFLAIPALASGDPFGVNSQKNAGLGEQDPREIIAQVIRIIMGFLGTVAVIIILLGGFKWMTAQGNQEKIDEARKLITAGITGLVIVLSAYAVSRFVLLQLMNATNVNVGG